jgi:hypothetical protein
MSLVRNDDCELAQYDRAELEALREIHSRTSDKIRKTKYQIAATSGFALAGASAAVALGTGGLGVVFVIGAAFGILCLSKSVD